MDRAKIKEIALRSGFKLKEQEGGVMELNEYVYAFADALIQEETKGLGADKAIDAINNLKFYIDKLPHHAAPESANNLIEDIRLNVYQNSFDAWRYRVLVESGKYCPGSIGGLWGLSLSDIPFSKKSLDEAIDYWSERNE